MVGIKMSYQPWWKAFFFFPPLGNWNHQGADRELGGGERAVDERDWQIAGVAHKGEGDAEEPYGISEFRGSVELVFETSQEYGMQPFIDSILNP